jgi:hypothetical protein
MNCSPGKTIGRLVDIGARRRAAITTETPCRIKNENSLHVIIKSFSGGKGAVFQNGAASQPSLHGPGIFLL